MDQHKFQMLRRRHVERLVQQEETRHRVTGLTHYRRMLNQLNEREEQETTFVHPIQECLENQYKRARGLYVAGGKHAYDEDARNWYAAGRRDLLRYEGAAWLTADEDGLCNLKPEDKIEHQLLEFVRQLPEDRRKMIYIADSLHGPPMFSSPRIKKCNGHVPNKFEELWVNFNEREWMMTVEVRGVRSTEL